MAEEDANEDEAHVQGAIVFCFEHAACAVVGKESIEDVDAIGREEVDVQAGMGDYC